MCRDGLEKIQTSSTGLDLGLRREKTWGFRKHRLSKREFLTAGECGGLLFPSRCGTISIHVLERVSTSILLVSLAVGLEATMAVTGIAGVDPSCQQHHQTRSGEERDSTRGNRE